MLFNTYLTLLILLQYEVEAFLGLDIKHGVEGNGTKTDSPRLIQRPAVYQFPTRVANSSLLFKDMKIHLRARVTTQFGCIFIVSSFQRSKKIIPEWLRINRNKKTYNSALQLSSCEEQEHTVLSANWNPLRTLK